MMTPQHLAAVLFAILALGALFYFSVRGAYDKGKLDQAEKGRTDWSKVEEKWFCHKCLQFWAVRGSHPGCDGEPADMTTKYEPKR